MSKTSTKKDIFVSALQLLYAASGATKIPSYYEDIVAQFVDAQKQNQKYTETFMKQLNDLFHKNHAMLVKSGPSSEVLTFVKDVHNILASMQEPDYNRVLESANVLYNEPSKSVKRVVPSYQGLDINATHKKSASGALSTPATNKVSHKKDTVTTQPPIVATPIMPEKVQIAIAPDHMVQPVKTTSEEATMKSSIPHTTSHKLKPLKMAQQSNNTAQAQKKKKQPMLMMDKLIELNEFLANRNKQRA